ncbi:MAG: HepT-like ribonuclease domain-containing protein [Candidatus Bathyarchaeia archaeon]
MVERVEELRRRLLDNDNVLLAYIFGSWVKDEAWSGSDVDVAVLLKDNSWGSVSRLIEDVAEALEVSVDKVDLVDLSKADDVLKYSVVSDGYKIVDKGFYEREIHERLYTKLFDTIRFLDSYIKDSFNPLRREVLARNLMALDEEVDVLKTYILSRTAAEVAEDPVARRVLRDSLRVAIESAIDICKHIVASMKLGVVREYKDFPLKLTEAGLMSRELAEELADFAKLRNIIVHRYVELNYALLYDKAKEFVNSVSPALRRQVEETRVY